jgi:hypothetical protein
MFRYPAHILRNLTRCSHTLPCSAFHKALELDRAMFAREVNRSLAHALVAAEMCALSHLPARVTAEKIGVARGVAQGDPASVMSADTWEDTLQLQQAVSRITLDVRGFGSC